MLSERVTLLEETVHELQHQLGTCSAEESAAVNGEAPEPFEDWTRRQLDKIGYGLNQQGEALSRIGDLVKMIEGIRQVIGLAEVDWDELSEDWVIIPQLETLFRRVERLDRRQGASVTNLNAAVKRHGETYDRLLADVMCRLESLENAGRVEISDGMAMDFSPPIGQNSEDEQLTEQRILNAAADRVQRYMSTSTLLSFREGTIRGVVRAVFGDDEELLLASVDAEQIKRAVAVEDPKPKRGSEWRTKAAEREDRYLR
jgi:hypothetical protein